MNGKQPVQVIAQIAPPVLLGVLAFLALKELFSARKNTETKPETTPTDGGTEINGKSTVDSVFSEPIPRLSAPLMPEIPSPVVIPDLIPSVKIVAQFPPRNKRKRIIRENMTAIFRHGSRKLTMTTAVAELKNLGFGKTAAYAALTPDGRFSAWLQFAPDGIITWAE